MLHNQRAMLPVRPRVRHALGLFHTFVLPAASDVSEFSLLIRSWARRLVRDRPRKVHIEGLTPGFHAHCPLGTSRRNAPHNTEKNIGSLFHAYATVLIFVKPLAWVECSDGSSKSDISSPYQGSPA